MSFTGKSEFNTAMASQVKKLIVLDRLILKFYIILRPVIFRKVVSTFDKYTTNYSQLSKTQHTDQTCLLHNYFMNYYVSPTTKLTKPNVNKIRWCVPIRTTVHNLRPSQFFAL